MKPSLIFLVKVHGVCWRLLKSVPGPLEVEQNRQLKLPSPSIASHPLLETKPDPKSVIGSRQLALSSESNSPIKLEAAEQSLKERGLRLQGDRKG